jgi:hypothetical protein
MADQQPQTLCDVQTHLIQKMDNGTYTCVQCGLGFKEHHQLVVGGGMIAQPQGAT